MPYAFFRAVEETVFETLERRRVRDCTVTMTHTGYWARQSSAHGVFDKSMSSTAGDFRGLTPLVLMAALRQAGTRCTSRCTASSSSSRPTRSGGAPGARAARRRPGDARAPGRCVLLAGTIPAANVYSLQQQLPG